VLPEDIGKFKELPCISGEPGKLGKNKTGDVSGLYVFKHFLGLWEADYGFAAYRLKMIDFFDIPALGLGVEPGTLFVVFRTFAFGLVFGGDPNPDAKKNLVSGMTNFLFLAPFRFSKIAHSTTNI